MNHLSNEYYKANPHEWRRAGGARPGCPVAGYELSVCSVRYLLLIVLLVLYACSSDNEPAATEANEPLPHTLNNRGVALMGRFDYPGAVKVFAAAVEVSPAWAEAKINLAIATLNRQNPGDEDAALKLLAPIANGLEADLVHAETRARARARASFTAGILQFNRGSTEEAQSLFQQAVSLAPEDAHAQYFLGQTFLQLGSAEQALEYFKRAGDLDSYLRSAFYGQFLAHQRLGQRAQAREMLAVYERLENNPRSKLAEIKYTRMGPLAMAVASLADETGAFAAQVPAGPLFAKPSILSGDGGVLSAAVRVDFAAESPTTAISVITADALKTCSFSGCTQSKGPISQPSASAWADMDNNGSPDRLVLGPLQGLWIQFSGEAQWTEVQAGETALAEGRWDNLALTDADHDGDLDVLVYGVGEGALLIGNNGNRTFRRLDDFMPGMISARQVVSVDLDQDRDLDLVLIAAEGPHQVLLNDRLWRYTDAGSSVMPWQEKPLIGVAPLDLDVDGELEWLVLTQDAATIWQKRQEGWQARDAYRHRIDGPAGLWVMDLSGNGRPEIIISGQETWVVLDVESGAEKAKGRGRILAPLLADTVSGPGLLAADEDGLKFLPPGPGRFAFATLALSGKNDSGQAMRTNASGLGTHMVVRGERRWQWLTSPMPALGAGQGLQPITVGLNGEAQIPSLTLDWSDGVYQSELDLEPGLHQVSETQRQLASCPVLFQFDGQEFQFVTDVLGVGGLGFNTGFGDYGQPRPKESVLLSPTPDADDQLRLLIAEPMEELAYLDHVSVSAVDFPSSLEPVLDERMATDGQQPSGEVFWSAQILVPTTVIDAEGTDVTSHIEKRDLDAAPLPTLDHQLAGLLAYPQTLTLTFSQDLSVLNEPRLIFDGWVEYGYSQTSFAAWQQGRQYDAVSLEIETTDAHGTQWRSWRPSFGYPAGMPRAASLPLGELPSGVRRLRLTTHQQIYFDRLAVAETSSSTGVLQTPVELHSAVVRHVGFPHRSNGPQMQPGYDFSQREAYWDTRYQRGQYTALGSALQLIEKRDNALVIIGPGDGLELLFKSPLPTLRPGYSRRWLVRFHGWAKDMDMFTENGETVRPVPADPRLNAANAQAINTQYNTRFRSGR
ncbi:MAG: tetratricopeptide repeat protein [Lysobacterales bacterium]